jgi:hypothetical protein
VNFSAIGKTLAKFAVDNSPAILTAIGVTGTVVTAYLTGKAAYKANGIIGMYEPFNGDPLPLKRKVELTWKLYIPAVSVGCTTIACIILANRVGTRRAAALAAAYSLSEKALEEYKNKVVEKIGERKEQVVRDEIAQDRVNASPPVSREIIITGDGDVLCMDSYSGRYFKSNMEKIRKAENDLNWLIINEESASLTDFYDLIGLSKTDNSDDVGWNLDKTFEIDFSGTLAEGKPCMVVTFATFPKARYYKAHR